MNFLKGCTDCKILPPTSEISVGRLIWQIFFNVTLSHFDLHNVWLHAQPYLWSHDTCQSRGDVTQVGQRHCCVWGTDHIIDSAETFTLPTGLEDHQAPYLVGNMGSSCVWSWPQLHRVTSLRMSGAMPTFPHVRSQLTQGQLLFLKWQNRSSYTTCRKTF
jgi:hypothetical protein